MQETQPIQGQLVTVKPPAWRGGLRILAAVVMIGGLAWVWVATESLLSDARDARAELSAIQVAQVYVEAAYQAITAIGLGLALYIASRFGE